VACLIAFAKLSPSLLPSPLGGEGLGVRGGPSTTTAPHTSPLPKGEREQSQLNWIAIAAGVLAAVATLVRPTWLLIAPAFAMWHGLRTGRAGWMQSCLLLAGLIVTLSPWVIRNYLATGHPVVTTLWVGPSLYDGLNPQATGDSDMTFIEQDGVYDRMSEYDADQHYRRAARVFVTENPGRAIQLAFAKLTRFWSPVPNAAQFGNAWVRIGVLACFVPLVVLAIVGWWHTWRDVSRWLLPLAPIVYFSLVHAVFVGSLRYRLPAEYPLAVLAAVGGRWLMKTRRS
ncbi:MAG: hypothetical protein HZA46_07920, partial [Planctomycetales bacterium]|nr:hypothetical protein [Planctomycetales bacterium]